MVLSLPVTGYVPGQDIPVTIEIDNASNVLITNVQCRLKKVSGEVSLSASNRMVPENN
jgi:uncharacterized membrane protein